MWRILKASTHRPTHWLKVLATLIKCAHLKYPLFVNPHKAGDSLGGRTFAGKKY